MIKKKLISAAAGLVLALAASGANAQSNGPAVTSPVAPAATGFFNSIFGSTDLVLNNTVTATFTITGVTNDGGGTDAVNLEAWDDGTRKAFVTVQVPVGQTQTFTQTVNWTGAIGTAAPCIGVLLSETTGATITSVDPFCLTGELPLSIAKSAAASVASGTALTYTITYGNPTTTPRTNVVITETLPANTTFVSATNGGTLAGNVVTWNIGNLAASTVGQTVQFTVNVTATTGFVTNSTYSIAATGVTTVAGAPAVTAVTAPVVISQVPTLDEIGLAVFVLLVGAAGFFALRKMV